MFVDRVSIHVRGGDGGQGCVSFRREKYVPHGGPNGGNGGAGGSVVIRAEEGVDSLVTVAHKKHWHAENGSPGQGSNRRGRSGKDLILAVPPGTVVRDRDRGHVLRDVIAAGDEVVVAYGGKRGRGNRAFASATNRAPRQWEPGGSGEQRWVELELKLIADVGLIGKPNAGKSTLLSRLSRARPEIADYPFTTKHPNLGLVQAGAEHRFVLADIPGLIEGAHAGAGLGHEFLRHVERTRLFVHLVEPAPSDGTEPLDSYCAIHRELELHDATLARRPEIVAVTKMDLPQAETVRRNLEQQLGRPVLGISAVTGQGLAVLTQHIAKALDELTCDERSQPAPSDAPPDRQDRPAADPDGSHDRLLQASETA